MLSLEKIIFYCFLGFIFVNFFMFKFIKSKKNIDNLVNKSGIKEKMKRNALIAYVFSFVIFPLFGTFFLSQENGINQDFIFLSTFVLTLISLTIAGWNQANSKEFNLVSKQKE